MKRIIAIIAISLISMITIAQPDPRQNGDGSNVGGEPIGSSAPIGGGTVIMSLLVAGWAAHKLIKERDNSDTNAV